MHLSSVRYVPWFAVMLLLGLQSCRPRITSVFPASGPPGTLVHVTGAELMGGLVRWDAGTSSSRSIPAAFLSASFFTVPLDATPGLHNVQAYIERGGESNIVQFEVTAGVVRPRPRVDDITCRGFSISRDTASFLLMVHGPT